MGEGFSTIWSWTIFVLLIGLGTIAGLIALVITVFIAYVLRDLFKYFRMYESLELLFLPFVRLGRNAFGDAEEEEVKKRETGRNTEAEEIKPCINDQGTVNYGIIE